MPFRHNLGRYIKMPEEETNVLQAMMVSVFGILTLVICMFAWAPVIDMFSDLGTSLEIINPSMLHSMDGILWFGKYIYYIIAITGVTLFVYPIIVVVKKHKYARVEAQQQLMSDENTW
jgi:hypothetical protein